MGSVLRTGSVLRVIRVVSSRRDHGIVNRLKECGEQIRPWRRLQKKYYFEHIEVCGVSICMHHIF